MNQLLDVYTFRARLSPAFLALLPALFGLTSWIPNVKSVTQPVTGAAISAGVLFILAYIARDAGKKAEKKLLIEWGGWPSTSLLRHRDSTLDAPTKRRYHEKLQKAISGVKLPLRMEEEAHSDQADEQYSSCRRFLLNYTRDSRKFPLVKEELINYGFRRNLFGLRPYGLSIALFGIFVCGMKLMKVYSFKREPTPLEFFCLGMSTIALLLWIFFVNKQFVRNGAEAYALKLLEAIETL